MKNIVFSFVKNKFNIILILGILIISSVYANQINPTEQLQSIINSLRTEIQKNNMRINNEQHPTQEIMEKVIVPYIDFIETAKWIAGKTAWRHATTVEQEAFLKEFKILVIRTYAVNLIKYIYEEIIFSPPANLTNKVRVQISSKVNTSDNKSFNVDYRLIRNDDAWKIYDIIVDGVSIVTGFQAQFSEQIRQEGLDVVTEKIKQHNATKFK